MTYSYNPAKIGERGKDQMRFELGDTLTDGGAATCALADEEYNGVLSGIKPGKRSWLTAKLHALEAIVFKLSYQVDTKIDVLQYDFGERADRWRKMYDELSRQLSAGTGIPIMNCKAQNKQPYFYTGMQENTRS